MMSMVKFYSDITSDDMSLVGGKNLKLGEMYNLCSRNAHNLLVPNGFALTTLAYEKLINTTNGGTLKNSLSNILTNLDVSNADAVEVASQKCKNLIIEYGFHQEWLKAEVTNAYALLCSIKGGSANMSLAVRSSATAEDLPDCSFAGQHDSYLNISGANQLFIATLNVIASLFNTRAIVYRAENGFDHWKVLISVGYMKMVRSDLATSGVAFSCDVNSTFTDVVTITSAYGLGESIVQGSVNPDTFLVFKPALRAGYRAVLHHSLGSKATLMCYDNQYVVSESKDELRYFKDTLLEVATPLQQQQLYSLSDKEVVLIADVCVDLESEFKTPVDVEFAKDGLDGRMYILQCRPETAMSTRTAKGSQNAYPIYHISPNHGDNIKIIPVTGLAIGDGIGCGPLVVLKEHVPYACTAVPEGAVLLCRYTSPDLVNIMKKCSAIVSESGGSTCHAAIVCREFGLPAIVGIGRDSFNVLSTYQQRVVTVSCCGEGCIYEGAVPFDTEYMSHDEIAALQPLSLAVHQNMSDPSAAFKRASVYKQGGVGLLRSEFVLSNIGTHPMIIVSIMEKMEKQSQSGFHTAAQHNHPTHHHHQHDVTSAFTAEESAFLKDNGLSLTIATTTTTTTTTTDAKGGKSGGETTSASASIPTAATQPPDTSSTALSPRDWYIRRVSEELGVIAAAFYPESVNIRLSDFKSNEYRQLIGGGSYESLEENPMIGFRGTSRYNHPRYHAGFHLELAAIARMRDVLGLANVEVMLPFVRSVSEATRVIALIKDCVSVEMKINMMVELPSNVFMINEYCSVGIDGFSIGSNDLIQLALGCDRDNSVLAACGYLPLQDTGVLCLIGRAINEAHQCNAKIGLCGDAACDPAFLKVLMAMGIDYVSVNPSSVVKTLKSAVLLEKKFDHEMSGKVQPEDEKEEEIASGMPMMGRLTRLNVKKT